ncbi:MAG TPA: hypothetical protein P5136_02720 [Methanofastidiosum sp.]|nr:hypothetical protein [Methanofastidiosum sp.]
MTVKELTEFLQKAREAYYNGESIISDEEFDRLEQELKRLDPNNPYFQQVGAPVEGGKKIKHSKRMMSLQNTRTASDVRRWANKYFTSSPVDILSQPKVDGVSITCKYKNGELKYIATRGDGEIGKNVSHLKKYVKDIPQQIPIDTEIEIRGEAYLPKDTELKDGKSLRNMAAGLINRKANQEDLKYLRFVAYDIVGLPVRSEEEKIRTLKTIATNVITYEKIGSFDDIQKIYNEYVEKKREQLPYVIDGVVLKINKLDDQNKLPRESGHHPNWAMAYKFVAETKKTRLIRIDWTTGATGKITPIAIFQPVDVDGATIQKASLGSKRKFELLKLEPGDVILVSRRNDVIPYVEANITKGVKNE